MIIRFLDFMTNQLPRLYGVAFSHLVGRALGDENNLIRGPVGDFNAGLLA